jgi:hypothetical protein
MEKTAASDGLQAVVSKYSMGPADPAPCLVIGEDWINNCWRL